MTSTKLFSLIFAAAFILVSCKKELEPQESVSEDQSVETMNSDGITDGMEDAQSPQMQAPQTMPNTSSPQQATPQNAVSGMNPAHGQPGHRCEIPVGAPLNSAPATTQTSQVTPTPAPTMQSKPAPTVTPSILNPGTTATTPGTNPAHGQPGHRCDIAVGQPLP